MNDFTEEELALLSPEEREAISDSIEDEDKAKELVTEEEVPKEEAAGAGKDDAEDAAPKVEASLEEAEPEEPPKVAPVVVPRQVEPYFVLEAEKTYGTQEEIEAKIAEVDQQFEDGDISLTEFNKQRTAYVQALHEINMFEKINVQVQKAAAEKAWKDSQADFYRDNPDYHEYRVKNVAFVDAVNRLLASDQSKTMTDAQVLNAAKAECEQWFNPSNRAVNPTDKEDVQVPTEKRTVVDAVKKAQAEKAATVKTLSKVPVAKDSMGIDKFDAIDELEGQAFENALAKLSEAELAVYAAR